jgi:hypothetical protein
MQGLAEVQRSREDLVRSRNQRLALFYEGQEWSRRSADGSPMEAADGGKRSLPTCMMPPRELNGERPEIDCWQRASGRFQKVRRTEQALAAV